MIAPAYSLGSRVGVIARLPASVTAIDLSKAVKPSLLSSGS